MNSHGDGSLLDYILSFFGRIGVIGDIILIVMVIVGMVIFLQVNLNYGDDKD